jgi:hypothetical protein
MLVLIAALDLWNRRSDGTAGDRAASWRQLVVSTFAALLIGVVFVWAIYRFRYDARPGTLSLNPTTDQYLQELTSSFGRWLLRRWRHQPHSVHCDSLPPIRERSYSSLVPQRIL